MKRSLVIIALICCGLSCTKKDKDNNTEYIEASVNGESYSFMHITTVRDANNAFKGAIGEYRGHTIVLHIPDTARNTYSLRVEGGTILNFAADYAEGLYRLGWITEQENNVVKYIAEAGVTNVNGVPENWRPVDSVNSKGNGNNSYEIYSYVPGYEHSFLAFRIRAIDGTGQSTFSNVRVMSQPTYCFYGQARVIINRGYASKLTVTGTEDDFVTGTFSFMVQPIFSTTPIKVENGSFRLRYR